MKKENFLEEFDVKKQQTNYECSDDLNLMLPLLEKRIFSEIEFSYYFERLNLMRKKYIKKEPFWTYERSKVQYFIDRYTQWNPIQENYTPDFLFIYNEKKYAFFPDFKLPEWFITNVIKKMELIDEVFEKINFDFFHPTPDHICPIDKETGKINWRKSTLNWE